MKEFQIIVMAPHVQIVEATDIQSAQVAAQFLRDQFESARLPNDDLVVPFLHSIYEIKDETRDSDNPEASIRDAAEEARRTQPFFDPWFGTGYGPGPGDDEPPRAA